MGLQMGPGRLRDTQIWLNSHTCHPLPASVRGGQQGLGGTGLQFLGRGPELESRHVFLIPDPGANTRKSLLDLSLPLCEVG